MGLALTGCGPRNPAQAYPPCPADGPELTALPVALSDVLYVTPLGNLNPPGHVFPTDHHYFYLRPSGTNKTVVTPAYAMATGWIASIGVSEHLDEGFTDYTLTLTLCQGYTLLYGHISALSSTLSAALAGASPSATHEYSTGGHAYRLSFYDLKLPVTSGEALGKAGGNPGQFALDIGAHDTRKEQNSFVNMDRYRHELSWFLYAVSPIDRLVPDLQAQVKAKLGGPQGTRTAPPVAGTVSYDVAGTAMGNWFREGAPSSPEDPHLALVKDNVDPGKYTISTGTSLTGWTGQTATFVPQYTGYVNRAFEATSTGTTYCYPVASGRLLLRLVTAEKLQGEYQAGKSCGDPLSFENPVAFVR